MLRQKLHSKKAEAYIDLIVSFIVLMTLLFAALIILRMYNLRNNLDYAAQQLIQTAATNGQFGTGDTPESAIGSKSFVTHRNRIEEELGIALSCNFNGTDYEDGDATTYKVQLGKVMMLTITNATPVRMGSGILHVDLKLSAKASACSEVYWKE